MLDPTRIRRPLRKLRKLLEQFPADPHPRQVHSLRTETRRIEAAVSALMLESDKEARRLLKTVTPLRKAAGRVRDMDVLTGDVLSLCEHHRGDSLVRLIQHLSTMRAKHAARLQDATSKHGPTARKRLKQFSQRVKVRLKEEAETGSLADAGAQILITELRHWPRMDESTLHAFRIRVKELTYLLQFSRDSDRRLIDRLSEVKDSAGDWHDWQKLLKTARGILDQHHDREVLDLLQATERKKLRAALSLATAVRKESFPSRRPSPRP